MQIAGHYNPRPVFELVANSLIKAIEMKDWSKVEELYEQVKKLSRD
jgi:hypothetical protein